MLGVPAYALCSAGNGLVRSVPLPAPLLTPRVPPAHPYGLCAFSVGVIDSGVSVNVVIAVGPWTRCCLHLLQPGEESQEELGSASWVLRRRETERRALTFGWFMGAMGCERHHRDCCCHAPVGALCALQEQSPPRATLCLSCILALGPSAQLCLWLWCSFTERAEQQWCYSQVLGVRL